MKITTPWDVEKLLREASFPNPSHKDALRERLFEAADLEQWSRGGEPALRSMENGILELSLGSLEMVAGGVAENEGQSNTDPETAKVICRYCGKTMRDSSATQRASMRHSFICSCGASYDPSASQKWTPPGASRQ